MEVRYFSPAPRGCAIASCRCSRCSWLKQLNSAVRTCGEIPHFASSCAASTCRASALAARSRSRSNSPAARISGCARASRPSSRACQAACRSASSSWRIASAAAAAAAAAAAVAAGCSAAPAGPAAADSEAAVAAAFRHAAAWAPTRSSVAISLMRSNRTSSTGWACSDASPFTSAFANQAENATARKENKSW